MTGKSTKLLELEKKALEKYQSAISENRNANDIVLDVSQCAEFLFKSICIIDFKEKETSEKINEPIPFLNYKNFFGNYHIKPFKFYSYDLKRVSKASEFINTLGNPEKHTKYNSEKSDGLGAISAIRIILKWYFKIQYDYTLLQLTLEQREVIENILNNEYFNDDILKKAKEKYFRYIEIVCGKIKLEGTTKEVAIEDFFVEIDTIELTNNNFLNKRIFSNVIIGGPGCGKSTILKCVAISCAFPNKGKQMLGDFDEKEKEFFPVYIRCRDIRKYITIPIVDIITNIPKIAHIPEITDQFKSLVFEFLHTDQLIILIDGLDEISEDNNRKIFLENLKIFLDTYPYVNIIITTREASSREWGNSFLLSGYCRYFKIAPLSKTQIKELVINWHKAVIGNSEITINKAMHVAEIINNDLNISFFAENPLLLTSLLLVNIKEGYIPTDKIGIYSQTIKILVELWNIEGHGHEQLDYDETELQLSYVAYWMTKNERLVINEDELKSCLKNAREIINRNRILDYSINDFINRVENRSSLLKKTGNSDYEFIHSNFQEYLTGIAIVNNYLPKEDFNIKSISFFKRNITKTYWLGVFKFLVFQINKQELNELLRYLISESINTNQKEWKKFSDFDSYLKEDLNKIIDNSGKYWNAYRKYCSVNLLGELLCEEIDFGDLFNEAFEWYSKNFTNSFTISTISITKNGKSFKEKVKYCFFNEYEDKYSIQLLNTLFYAGYHNFIKTNVDSFYIKIKENILKENKVEKCISILSLCSDLTLISPELSELAESNVDVSIIRNNVINKIIINTDEIFKEILKTTSLDDPHYYIVIAAVFNSYVYHANNLNEENYRNIVYKNISCKDEYLKIFINGWIHFSYYNIQRYTSFVLNGMLNQNMNFDIRKEFSNIEDIVIQRYEKPINCLDKIVAKKIGKLIHIFF